MQEISLKELNNCWKKTINMLTIFANLTITTTIIITSPKNVK
jgi:hypothetical protein